MIEATSPSPSPAPPSGGWEVFVAWAAGDPGAVATFVAAVLALVAAGIAAAVAVHGNKVARDQNERTQGFTRYIQAVQWISSGSAPLEIEGARVLGGLLKSSWPTNEDREMAESLLRDYTDGKIPRQGVGASDHNKRRRGRRD